MNLSTLKREAFQSLPKLGPTGSPVVSTSFEVVSGKRRVRDRFGQLRLMQVEPDRAEVRIECEDGTKASGIWTSKDWYWERWSTPGRTPLCCS